MDKKWNVETGLVLAAGTLAILGAFLPWGVVSSPFGQMSINGIDGDGKITAILGGIILLVLLIGNGIGEKPGNQVSGIGSILLSLVITYMAGDKIFAISGIQSGSEYVITSVGMGLYITLVAGITGIIGGLALEIKD